MSMLPEGRCRGPFNCGEWDCGRCVDRGRLVAGADAMRNGRLMFPETLAKTQRDTLVILRSPREWAATKNGQLVVLNGRLPTIWERVRYLLTGRWWQLSGLAQGGLRP